MTGDRRETYVISIHDHKVAVTVSLHCTESHFVKKL